MPGLDQSVFHWINGWPEWLRPIFYFLSYATKLWYGIALLVAVLIFLVRQPRFRVPVAVAWVGVALSNETCDILKASFQMLRPCVAEATLNLRVEKLTSFGTASAHSANMAAVAAALWFVDRRWGIAWSVIALLVGLSRIYNGVHYPSQVLLGWTVGALVSVGLMLATQRWWRAHNTSDEPERA